MLARVILGALLLLAGCVGAWCGVRVYRPLIVSGPASGARLFAAAERAAHELGAATIETAPEELRLSAIFPAAGSAHEREHLRVQVSDWGDLAIDVRTELETDSGTWVAPDTVCSDYSHAREKEIAAKILGAI